MTMKNLKDSLKFLGFSLLLLIAVSSAKAQNSAGTVTDIDGNTYHTVKIGKQVWMVENLRVTRYADGTPIKQEKSRSSWAALKDNNSDKAYCYHNMHKKSYGCFYTYAAATNGDNSGYKVQGVCPDGWHLPSDKEWDELNDYLKSKGHKAAKALASKKYWSSSSVAGAIGNCLSINNQSGFTALPDGYRGGKKGRFASECERASWHSSTDPGGDGRLSSCYFISYDRSFLTSRNFLKSGGRSVRCIKD